LFQELANREEGQDLIEYGLITFLITLALITSLNGICTYLVSAFNTIATSF
jgi:Flp pilus assembly pilin Flp